MKLNTKITEIPSLHKTPKQKERLGHNQALLAQFVKSKAPIAAIVGLNTSPASAYTGFLTAVRRQHLPVRVVKRGSNLYLARTDLDG